MTALAAENPEVIDRMNFEELCEVADNYGFGHALRGLTRRDTERVRQIVKEQARAQKKSAYGEAGEAQD